MQRMEPTATCTWIYSVSVLNIVCNGSDKQSPLADITVVGSVKTGPKLRAFVLSFSPTSQMHPLPR
jgi:hypothetical protein